MLAVDQTQEDNCGNSWRALHSRINPAIRICFHTAPVGERALIRPYPLLAMVVSGVLAKKELTVLYLEGTWQNNHFRIGAVIRPESGPDLVADVASAIALSPCGETF